MNSITLKPRASEKSYALSESHNTYVFEVPKNANKHLIAQAVTEQFNVTVTGVRVASSASKTKRSYRRGKYVYGTRSSYQKAYVTLKEGDKLPIFAAEEETKPANDGGKK